MKQYFNKASSKDIRIYFQSNKCAIDNKYDQWIGSDQNGILPSQFEARLAKVFYINNLCTRCKLVIKNPVGLSYIYTGYTSSSIEVLHCDLKMYLVI